MIATAIIKSTKRRLKISIRHAPSPKPKFREYDVIVVSKHITMGERSNFFNVLKLNGNNTYTLYSYKTAKKFEAEITFVDQFYELSSDFERLLFSEYEDLEPISGLTGERDVQ